MLKIVLVHATREHSKNKQDRTFAGYFFFISGLFVFIKMTRRLKQYPKFEISINLDMVQYPAIANQSNCAILGGSRVASTKVLYILLYIKWYRYYILIQNDVYYFSINKLMYYYTVYIIHYSYYIFTLFNNIFYILPYECLSSYLTQISASI